jgi:hypothetical protein
MTTTFTGPLSIREATVDSETWELLEPLVWGDVTIPAGFKCDGASIPFPVSLVFPHWGRKYRRPAVLHDYLLSTGTPRSICDRTFLAAMKACGVVLPVRWGFYYAVGFFSALQAWRHALGR